MDYVSKYLDPLYENDSIFDRFPIAVDDISNTVVTGLYDGAVAVWQPLSKGVEQEEEIVHYRVDPNVAPADVPNGSRVTAEELDRRLSKSWQQPSDTASGTVETYDDIPEPFTNKVLNVAIAPGGERFAYTYKNGSLVYFLERC
ncbi:hypothetical protein ADEAN_000372900 [Angomonas deanei]|uniref:Uncharacterized protein n=1 Tax=Angomonas deanei TaxID=59799 RepID=A0A7G2C939_9TRYP|nr:hypothetical protein ADEAN_000372900 [Angomonas deanei]